MDNHTANPLNVGLFSYFNSLPFWAAFQLGIIKPEAKISYDNPKALNGLFEKKALQLSMVSSLSYWKLRQQSSPFLSFGIGARKKVKSVLLITRFALEKLSEKTIWLTHESETSIALLQVLCSQIWNVAPHLQMMPEKTPPQDADAYLLIGNQALTHILPAGYEAIDLAEAWCKATQLPFIFGLFAIYHETLSAQNEKVIQFEKDLQASYQWSVNHREKLVTKAHEISGMPDAFLDEYLNTLDFVLTDEHYKGFNLFINLYEKYVQQK